MSDEQLPLRAELASAYLDGELDANERVAAAADPEVMKAVDSLTRVRAALGEINPVVASTKTAAIAAALAEFDALHAADAATAVPAIAPARIISLKSRRERAYQVLTRVAAVLVIGVVAVAALKAVGGSSDSKDSASSATELSPAAATEVPQLKIAAETAGAAETSAAAAGTAAPGADSATDAGGFADVPSIDSDDALRQFAAAIEATSSTPQVAAPAPAATVAAAATSGGLGLPSCLSADQTLLGQIVYRGTAAFAVRNTTTGDVQAIADTDCRVLTQVEP